MKYTTSQPKNSDSCSLCEAGECPGCRRVVLESITNVTNFVEETVQAISVNEWNRLLSTDKSSEQSRNDAIKSGLILGSVLLMFAFIIFKLWK